MTEPLLVDADPGCDDAIALSMALECDAVDVVGVTTIFGNAPTAETTKNARAILELLERTDVPVARGATEPLLVELDTAEHIHGEGGIRGDLPEQTAASAPADVHAARFIVQQARQHDGDLRLLAIGRLTNVALALALEPALPDLLDELVVMGGSVYEPGHTTPMASANFYGDPHAARRVVRDCYPTIVGVDVSQHATLSADWIDSLPRETPAGAAMHRWFTYYSSDVLDRYDIETAAIHDALPMAYLLDETVLDTEAHYMEVGADEGLAQGALACDLNEMTGEDPTGRVALDLDDDRYRDLVMNSINRLLA